MKIWIILLLTLVIIVIVYFVFRPKVDKTLEYNTIFRNLENCNTENNNILSEISMLQRQVGDLQTNVQNNQSLIDQNYNTVQQQTKMLYGIVKDNEKYKFSIAEIQCVENTALDETIGLLDCDIQQLDAFKTAIENRNAQLQQEIDKLNADYTLCQTNLKKNINDKKTLTNKKRENQELLQSQAKIQVQLQELDQNIQLKNNQINELLKKHQEFLRTLCLRNDQHPLCSF
jgi:peptidoglycan hydrolase CwlO-like protein